MTAEIRRQKKESNHIKIVQKKSEIRHLLHYWSILMNVDELRNITILKVADLCKVIELDLTRKFWMMDIMPPILC